MLDGAAFFQQRTIRVVAEATRCAAEEAK